MAMLNNQMVVYPRVNQKIPHESRQFLRRGIVGRDHYGVFPLRGKLRNVRELTVTWQTLAGRHLSLVPWTGVGVF